MLAEFVDAITKLAHASMRPRWVDAHPLLPGTAMLAHPSGTVEAVAIPPRPRHGTRLDSVGDLVDFVSDLEACPSPEVYVERFGVQVVLSREIRHELAWLPLTRTDRWNTIVQLSGSPLALDVRSASKMLRYRLQAPEHVVAAVSRVDFVRKSTGAASAEHGKESLGQSVEAWAQQADQIPTEFFVDARVFAEVPEMIDQRARMSLYVDLQASRIELGVYPDEVSSCESTALGLLTAALRAAISGARGGVPVRRGWPGADAIMAMASERPTAGDACARGKQA